MKSLYNREFAEKYDKIDFKHFEKIRDLFLKHNFSRGNILDIGCGTGKLKLILGKNFHYTGIDSSEFMLEFAKTRYDTIIEDNFENLLQKIESKSFDFLFSLSSLVFFPETEEYLSELKRISKICVVVSFDDFNEIFINKFPKKVYNHTKIKIENTIEDQYFYDYDSILTNEKISTRLIIF